MDHHSLPSNDNQLHEAGFSLVEILIAMLIFLIAATGVSYSLAQSDRQMITAEKILNGEQYGMVTSVAGGNKNPTMSISLSGQQQQINAPIAITLSPAPPSQACTPGILNGIGQIIGNFLQSFLCIFGGCSSTPATVEPTSLTVSVPVTAITTSDSQIAWWEP